jgi:diguanylate cyclase (GGDEF)-like protein
MYMMRWMIALWLLLCAQTPVWAEDVKRPTVLVLMSYHQNYTWEQTMLAGIESVWPQTDEHAPRLVMEWMDTKRYPEPAYSSYFHEFFGQKYKNQHFDLILTGDDNALKFVGDNPQWFSRSPVVFAGVNGDPFDLISGRTNVTGITERFDFTRTFKLALTLHPQIKRMVLIGNTDETAVGVFRNLRSDLHRMAKKEGLVIPPTVEWRGLSQPELGHRLDALSPDSLVFVFGTLRAELDHSLMDPSETTAFVRQHTKAPIYSDTISTLGHGVVGGYFNDGYNNGVLQAQMGQKVLESGSTRILPIVNDTPYQLAFDAHELSRFDISDRDLPPDATIINRRKTLLDPAYRPYLMGSVVVVLMLLAVMVLFIYRAQTERLRHQALVNANLKDELTGLKNRSGLALLLQNIELDREAKQVSSVAMVMFGLRRFKMINDSYGQSVGDQLLIAVSERIGSLLDQHSDLARLSGDVFAVVYRYQDSALLAHFVERLEAAFVAPFALDRQSLLVRMSCGVSTAQRNNMNAAQLTREAETAMHRAKKEHVAHLVFEAHMHADNIRDREIEEMLPRALQEKAITMEYQAVRSLQENRVVGYEALARWRQSKVGFISPVDFVRVATESGQMADLTRYVLRTSCNEFQALLAEDKRLYLAVNVSVGDLYSADFCQHLDQILSETNFPADQLVLEVTEDLSLNNVEGVRVMLNDLRQRGLRISIDDFGTGYSSMRYLSSYTIDTLKIDRSFVQDILTNESNQKIVRAIVSMGNDLGLSVITEGVEHMEQARLLHRLGCILIQGFAFSRPQPIHLSLESFKREYLRADLYSKMID